MKTVKTFVQFIACMVALSSGPAWGQAVPNTTTLPNRLPTSPGSLPPPPPPIAGPNSEEPTKFDLDFPGGTPKELVAAIQKAMRRPLNAIVPEEFAEQRLPALKMDHVNVAQLFEALAAASRKSEAVTTSSYGGQLGQNYQVVITGYGFRQASQGRITDDTIWYFYVEKPALPPFSSQPRKTCRFYPLAGYSDHNMTVDDITTAIETGWKMLGENPTPAISYHKDRRLLIAVGEPNKLETIDLVLRALSEAPKPRAVPPPPPPTANPPEKPKKEKGE